MSIAPVKCSVDVKGTAARAFDIFSKNMAAWWPRGRTPAKNPHVDLVIEPKQDGRWFERDAQGTETQWGKVLAWDPPRRLVLGWQLNHQFRFDPNVLTEVEILFQELPGGVTRVSLEHRDLDRLGTEAKSLADKIRSGWPERMGDFAKHFTGNSQGATMPQFTVYTIPGSPAARAVMATLVEKAAPFRVVGLVPGALKTEPHISRHPFGKMPVLEHDHFLLYETQAILRYLDRVVPTPSLVPRDVQEAARMDQIMGISDWYLAQTPEWRELTHGRRNLIEWLERMNERRSMSSTTWESVAQLALASD